MKMLKKAKKIAVKQLESKNGGNIYCHKYANIGLDISSLSCYTTNLFSKITIYKFSLTDTAYSC